MEWRRVRGWLTRERIYKALGRIFSASNIIMLGEVFGYAALAMTGYFGLTIMMYGLGIMGQLPRYVGTVLVGLGMSMLAIYAVITWFLMWRRGRKSKAKVKAMKEEDKTKRGFRLTFTPLDDNAEDTPYLVSLERGSEMDLMTVSAMLHSYSIEMGSQAQVVSDMEERMN